MCFIVFVLCCSFNRKTTPWLVATFHAPWYSSCKQSFSRFSSFMQMCSAPPPSWTPYSGVNMHEAMHGTTHGSKHGRTFRQAYDLMWVALSALMWAALSALMWATLSALMWAAPSALMWKALSVLSVFMWQRVLCMALSALMWVALSDLTCGSYVLIMACRHSSLFGEQLHAGSHGRRSVCQWSGCHLEWSPSCL